MNNFESWLSTMPTLYDFESKNPAFSFHHSTDPHPMDPNFLMHVHDEYEILYLISGNIEYYVETSVYQMKPRSLLITRCMETHRVHILSSAPYERYCINFSASCLNGLDPSQKLLLPFLNRPLGQGNLFLPEDFTRIDPQGFLQAMSEASEAKTLDDMLIYLYPLLGEICHAFSHRQQFALNTPKSNIDKIVEYVNSHLFDELSLELLSTIFYLSTSQISRLFKNATGSSFWNYVQFKRLAAAQQLLREGKTAKQACEASGFNDYSVFYRAYVKRFGSSPSSDNTL